ncbi:MAG: hypothetical protein JWM19_936 [Actinomycetia bacterium]|nr:hypothetical protein [Actinomycetes bacterium]
MAPEPTPVRDLDEQLGQTFRRSRRILWVIMISQGVVVILLVAAVSVLGVLQAEARASAQSQCEFYAPLVQAGQQLTPKSSTKLGIELVEGSRRALLGLGCSYPLPSPSPVLLQLGRKYGVPITY